MRNAIWVLVHFILILAGFMLARSTLAVATIGTELALGVSASLIAAGVTGCSLYLHNFFLDKRETLKNALYDSGLRGIFNGRSIVIKSEYTSRIDKSDNLDIMGFGLSSFREDYQERLLALAASKKVRILLLHPEFPKAELSYADQRDKEERNSAGTIKSDIESFINETKEAREKFPEQFQVRLMTCLPSINLFRFDKEILWGPYLVGEQSRNMPTFLVAKGEFLFDKLSMHFDRIWSDDRLSVSCDS